MNLPSTTYQTPIRRVSGTVTLYSKDVVLEVDTSSTPCSITLGAIASNYWNTTWKLYVFDYSSNCATNNITINAGTGTDGSQQKINGANSIVLSTNSAGVVIRILSNGTFIAISTSLLQTIYYQTVQDEGSSVTQRFITNFVGSGVTVTDSGGKTVVTIPGATTQGITSLTSAALISLVSTAIAGVVPGQFYLVTDGGNSNGGVLVQGVTTTSVTRYGGALFLNADYQGVGSYQAGLGAQMGIWSSVSQVVSANAVVIYNNNHYKNLTGAWGTAPSGDATNWLVLTKSVLNGYILEIDFVEYDVLTNVITYRRDTRGNEVDRYVSGGSNAIVDFQWGRDAASFNRIFGQSIYSATNSNATLTGNFIYNSTFTETTKTTTPGTVKYNSVIGGSVLTSTNTLGEISYNEVSAGASVLCNNDLSVNTRVRRNVVREESILTLNTCSNTNNILNNTMIGKSVLTSSGTISNGDVIENFLSNGGTLTFSELTSLNISGCEVSDDITAALGVVASSKINYKVRQGYSSWLTNLDLSNGAIFSGTTLTIPAAFTYIGIFTSTNAATKNITKIVNAPTNHPFIIRPTNTDTFQITAVAVAGAVLDEILATTVVAPFIATGRTNGGDELVLYRYGTFNGLQEARIWA